MNSMDAKRGPKKLFTAEQVIVMRILRNKGCLQKHLAKHFGVSRMTISRITNRKCYKWVK